MLFRMIGPTMKNLVRKPVTRRYPFEPYVPHARTRGKIVIEFEKCNFCLLCDRRCPTHAIVVDRPGKVWQIDRLRCIQCGRCVEVCPKDCLAMDPHYSSPVVAGNFAAAIERHETPQAVAAGPEANAPPAAGASPAAPAASADGVAADTRRSTPEDPPHA